MKKILATLGPSSLLLQTIHEMDREDVYLYRINMSHTAIDKLRNTIELIQNSTSTPICIDSEGAQLRNNNMNNDNVLFRIGSTISIHYSNVVGDCNNISFNHIKEPDVLSIGDEIGIDFYGAKVQVIESTKDCGQALVISEGVVGSNKAATINKKISLPVITEKDIAAIQISREMGVTNFALSFAKYSVRVCLRELNSCIFNCIRLIPDRVSIS